ncbi:hypothetical protein C5S53_12895 [Methanophagales archaeon]|nr:hypothetical protein C5S53_12895 [Methanophagales archaeon]
MGWAEEFWWVWIMLSSLITWIFGYFIGPWFASRTTLRRELAATYLVPFTEWCCILYKEITEFKERYASVRDNCYNQLSRTLIIMDYRELHDVLKDTGRYVGKIKKEEPEVAEYLSKLAGSVDLLWHGLQDDFSENFDQSNHDEWIKAIIDYPEKEEFVKGIIETKKQLNQALLGYFQSEKKFEAATKYLLRHVP